MIQMIDEHKALGITERYFGILKSAGYVKPAMMKRYFIYMFLLDFVDYTHRFFTEADYNAVDTALRKLFAVGGCLLPYSVSCVDRVKVGTNDYMGTLKVRKTENGSEDKDGNGVGYEDRFTEDEQNRVI